MLCHIKKQSDVRPQKRLSWVGLDSEKRLFLQKDTKRCEKRFLNAERVVYDANDAMQFNYFREYDSSSMP